MTWGNSRSRMMKHTTENSGVPGSTPLTPHSGINNSDGHDGLFVYINYSPFTDTCETDGRFVRTSRSVAWSLGSVHSFIIAILLVRFYLPCCSEKHKQNHMWRTVIYQWTIDITFFLLKSLSNHNISLYLSFIIFSLTLSQYNILFVWSQYYSKYCVTFCLKTFQQIP